METYSRTLIDEAPASSTATSSWVSGLHLSALSFSAVVAGGSGIAGTLYLDGSNDQRNPSNYWSPTGTSIAVSGNVSTGTTALATCFVWVRARWVPSAGTGGTISVAMMAQSGPSPTSPFANGLIETSGPTPLLMGAWADGLYARRSGDTIIGAAAGVSVEAVRIADGVITNYFFAQAGVSVTAASVAPSTNVMRARPIVFGRNGTITSLGVMIAGAVVNAVGRVAIYEAGADGAPSTLVVESGQLNLATQGRKSATGLNTRVSSASRYWAVYLGGVAAANIQSQNTSTTIGFVGTAAGTSLTNVRLLTVAQAYGTMPAVFPAGAAVSGTDNLMPIVLCGVS